VAPLHEFSSHAILPIKELQIFAVFLFINTLRYWDEDSSIEALIDSNHEYVESLKKAMKQEGIAGVVM